MYKWSKVDSRSGIWIWGLLLLFLNKRPKIVSVPVKQGKRLKNQNNLVSSTNW
uniref:Uncharacterized protein n=1 Tax=Anguilla anguilla TaxID=7936 RepID=A0A0E9UJX2_ANGAN